MASTRFVSSDSRRANALVDLLGLAAARLREVGPAAALAADHAAVSRTRSPALKRLLEIRRDAERERHAPLGGRGEQHDPAAELVRAARPPSRAARRRPPSTRARSARVTPRSRSTCAARSPDAAPRCVGAQRARAPARAARCAPRAASRRAPRARRSASASSSAVRSSARSCSRRCGAAPRRRSAPRCAARPTRSPDSPTTLSSPMSPVARACVPPHSSFEKSPNEIDAHAVAVLLAEHRDRAGCDRVGYGIILDAPRGRVLLDPAVDEVLDRVELLARDRRVVAEVEAQAVRRDQRAALRRVRPEHRAQCRVQAGACRSGGARRRARFGVDA